MESILDTWLRNENLAAHEAYLLKKQKQFRSYKHNIFILNDCASKIQVAYRRYRFKRYQEKLNRLSQKISNSQTNIRFKENNKEHSSKPQALTLSKCNSLSMLQSHYHSSMALVNQEKRPNTPSLSEHKKSVSFSEPLEEIYYIEKSGGRSADTKRRRRFRFERSFITPLQKMKTHDSLFTADQMKYGTQNSRNICQKLNYMTDNGAHFNTEKKDLNQNQRKQIFKHSSYKQVQDLCLLNSELHTISEVIPQSAKQSFTQQLQIDHKSSKRCIVQSTKPQFNKCTKSTEKPKESKLSEKSLTEKQIRHLQPKAFLRDFAKKQQTTTRPAHKFQPTQPVSNKNGNKEAVMPSQQSNRGPLTQRWKSPAVQSVKDTKASFLRKDHAQKQINATKEKPVTTPVKKPTTISTPRARLGQRRSQSPEKAETMNSSGSFFKRYQEMEKTLNSKPTIQKNQFLIDREKISQIQRQQKQTDAPKQKLQSHRNTSRGGGDVGLLLNNALECKRNNSKGYSNNAHTTRNLYSKQRSTPRDFTSLQNPILRSRSRNNAHQSPSNSFINTSFSCRDRAVGDISQSQMSKSKIDHNKLLLIESELLVAPCSAARKWNSGMSCRAINLANFWRRLTQDDGSYPSSDRFRAKVINF